MKRLLNKIVLITGGARGIGASAVTLMHQEGAYVVIADVLDVDGKALEKRLGAKTKYVHLDVSSKDSWENAISITEESFGALDILVNNAGISDGGYLKDLSLETYQKVINVNQIGVFLGMQTAYPSLRKNKTGSIINVSSIYGIYSDVHSVAYVASKFAVRGMTKVAAVEFGRFGIRVNSIHPGLIKTPMTSVIGSDDDFGYIPLAKREDAEDRAGLPEDVAKMMLFLASDESGYVNGAEFVIDGALTLNRETSAKLRYFESVKD